MKVLKIFFIFLRLGCTSFGGPIAHLGYFHNEFVQRRKWLDEVSYADLVALCQFLPGPASSQVGLAIGLSQGGSAGAFAAWLGFTLPSALLLSLFASGITHFSEFLNSNLLHGLKIAAVAIVAQALWAMAQKLSRGKLKLLITATSTILVLFLPFAFGQILALALGGIAGWFLISEQQPLPATSIKTPFSAKAAARILVTFVILITLLPVAAKMSDIPALKIFDQFFRAGSLVFGGGHVVLPLLKAETVDTGFVSPDLFLAGYGAAQAIPGPLFTFSAYLGMLMMGWWGSLLALLAAFLPSFFLVFGTMPLWEKFRSHSFFRSAMTGINAAVVGLLLAAFITPILSSGIHSIVDFAIASGALFLLWRGLPSWAVVIFAALAAWLCAS